MSNKTNKKCTECNESLKFTKTEHLNYCYSCCMKLAYYADIDFEREIKENYPQLLDSFEKYKKFAKLKVCADNT